MIILFRNEWLAFYVFKALNIAFIFDWVMSSSRKYCLFVPIIGTNYSLVYIKISVTTSITKYIRNLERKKCFLVMEILTRNKAAWQTKRTDGHSEL